MQVSVSCRLWLNAGLKVENDTIGSNGNITVVLYGSNLLPLPDLAQPFNADIAVTVADKVTTTICPSPPLAVH